MLESDHELATVIAYIKAHWPSQTKWQVALEDYPELIKKALIDLTAGKTRAGNLMRVAGLSGSGKTSQLLPTAEAYFARQNLQPVVVAARIFVEYHPKFQEIIAECGEEGLRKETDEFATIMLFAILKTLISQRFDIILDVTLLDPKMEAILVQMLTAAKYTATTLMIAVSPEVTERFLRKRSWRHDAETEKEFVRATREAMRFYAENCPEMRLVMWNVYADDPIYDGNFAGALPVFEKYSSETEIPAHNKEKLKLAKIKYLAG